VNATSGGQPPDFGTPAPEAVIQKVAAALRANNIDTQGVLVRQAVGV